MTRPRAYGVSSVIVAESTTARPDAVRSTNPVARK